MPIDGPYDVHETGVVRRLVQSPQSDEDPGERIDGLQIGSQSVLGEVGYVIRIQESRRCPRPHEQVVARRLIGAGSA